MARKHLISDANPMGTDGFEFVEFASSEPQAMTALFEQLGFTAIARHRSKNVMLFRQGDINFILNAEPSGQAARFRQVHGPSANAMAFRVGDARAAYERALDRGAEPAPVAANPMELHIPAIKGIGDSALFLVDRWGEDGDIYDVDFEYFPGVDRRPKGVGLETLDHLTHNVYTGRMSVWADFYSRLFNFREIRYFDIEGRHTGLLSKAMTGPCGKLRIPINESQDEKSQIAEYLRDYRGEGIQHIALSTADIFRSVEDLRGRGVQFLKAPPETYYELLETRVPGHGEDVARLRSNAILLDGAAPRILLQIFTEPCIGPIFFEIIQRKGDDGFGEGNFRALFEAMEQDQIRRGTLKVAETAE
ncbi:MAG TPA: 4-hydroxyphenylpyruvate dioxygenase [Hyphomonadaceae bacterium]|nr:4-hydroxyphenylpyruvate dioxygenase [Hyphomonadaceae bacterium]